MADPGRLSSVARRALEKESARGVCAISVWELAVLVDRGRLVLDRDVAVWVDDALAIPGVELLPLTPAIALAAGSTALKLHGDPADRMIAATALAHRARLVTKDERLRAVPALDSIW